MIDYKKYISELLILNLVLSMYTKEMFRHNRPLTSRRLEKIAATKETPTIAHTLEVKGRRRFVHIGKGCGVNKNALTLA